MSLKMRDLSRKQVEKLVVEYGTKPAFIGQNPYIANGPNHEILASIMPNGLYQVELLDKKEMEESLQQMINAFKKFAAVAKS